MGLYWADGSGAAPPRPVGHREVLDNVEAAGHVREEGFKGGDDVVAHVTAVVNDDLEGPNSRAIESRNCASPWSPCSTCSRLSSMPVFAANLARRSGPAGNSASTCRRFTAGVG